MIDWVDFIKINGTQYQVINSAIITDSSYIGKKVGEVAFKVADNVSNPKYQFKNGDAAFWEPGTEIFGIRDDISFAGSDGLRHGVCLLDVGSGFGFQALS
jgi:hypothetical protein